MTKRIQTLLAVLAMYVVAFIAGAILFFLLAGDPLLRVFVADVLMTVVIWLFGLAFRNSSVYDPYWSVVPPFLLLIAIIDAPVVSLAGVAVLIALSVWAVRLTWNWAKGWTDFKDQDWRYTMIHDKMPRLWFLSNFFGIMMFPTLIVFVQLAGAIRFVAAGGGIDVFTIAACAIILGAAFIQYVADRQMADFRVRHAGKKACIEAGLWKLSRHPNYFGEVMVWWGLYLAHFGQARQIDLFILAPLLMTAMFLFISIPMMEKKILSTRPGYAGYQKRVSVLIPFFRKKDIDGAETPVENRP
ncbi:MAG: DUF1295 domain-containing protein [bacterium]